MSSRRTVTAACLVVLTAAVGATTGATTGATASQRRFPASEQPVDGTARVMDGHVYGIAATGHTVVVAGDFTTVRDFAAGSPQQTRDYLFAYDDRTGEVSHSFVPDLDGTVEAVAVTDGGSKVLVAGSFKTVDGVPHRGIARLNLSDGSLDPSFTGTTSNAVLDMGVTRDEIVVGGYFDRAGGQERSRLAALDPDTGEALPGLNPGFAGVLHPGLDQITQVRELDVSPDGRWLVVVGNFTTVGGVPREQVALFDLDTYTLSDWHAPQLAGWPCKPNTNAVTWVTSAEFAPSSKYLVTGGTGAFRRGTLCDTVARFEVPPTSSGAVDPTWVDYTGGDSIFRVQPTKAAVYAGGHPRWFNNPTPSTVDGGIKGDRDGPGAVTRYGIAALDPATGLPLTWFPNRDGARPQRGFEAIVTHGDQLLLGSDSTRIGGETRQRLAAYSTARGRKNPPPARVSLPARLYALDHGLVRRVGFDGRSFGKPRVVSGPRVDGRDWGPRRDGFVQRGTLTLFRKDGSYARRRFTSTIGRETNLSRTVGYTDDGAITDWDQPRGIGRTRAAAYVGGRVLYTRAGSSKLYWRWYSTQSGIMGAQQYVADDRRDWGTTRALEVVSGDLYAVDEGRLVRYPLQTLPTSVSVTGGPTVVDNGSRSRVDWSRVRGLWARNTP